MYSLRFRIAQWVFRNRRIAWALFAAITAFFAVGLRDVQIKTIFSDLLPKTDPYVQVFNDHRNFGNPLTMTIMVKRKDGPPGAEGAGYEKTIYNQETLAKIWQLTRDIDLAIQQNLKSSVRVAVHGGYPSPFSNCRSLSATRPASTL